MPIINCRLEKQMNQPTCSSQVIEHDNKHHTYIQARKTPLDYSKRESAKLLLNCHYNH